MTREEACTKIHETAVKELGIHETPGPEATARIVEYAKHTTLSANSDETPWCSSFCNFVVDTAGFKGTHLANARSWLDWGIVLDKPIVGCVVVLKRDPPPSGHVGICNNADIENGIIQIVGGNQSDSVKVSRFPVEHVLGYRSPI